MKSVRLLTLLSAAILSLPTLAQTIQIKDVQCRSQGCRGAQIVAAPDDSLISILFNKFQVSLGGTSGNRPIDQILAQLSFNVVVPTGFELEFLNLDFRGFAATQAGVSGLIESRQLLKGKKLAPPERVSSLAILPQTLSDFFFTSHALAGTKTECGDEVNFKIQTRLQLDSRRNRNTGNSQIIMDSTDIGNPSIAIRTSVHPCR